MTGGFNNCETFLFEKELRKWRKCQDLPTQRERLRCGVVKRTNGREEVVVAGGKFNKPLDTVEIFSLADGAWRKGENLRYKILSLTKAFCSIFPRPVPAAANL